MKYTKKILLLALCAAMLLPSCGKGADTETTIDTSADAVVSEETTAETTRLDVRDSLPVDLRFNGE